MVEQAEGAAAVTMTIRRATPDDARAIAEVTVASWQAAYRGILPQEFLESLRVEPRRVAWQAMLSHDSSGGTPAWVAEDQGRVWAFVSAGPARDEDVTQPAGEIYALYVEPSAWRQGLGRSLLATATAHLLEDTGATLTLWVLEANLPARAFYEAMGWEADGARREFDLGGSTSTEVRYRRLPG
jgi:ribosomal protein S18 acetylase RimI-like enzyme